MSFDDLKLTFFIGRIVYFFIVSLVNRYTANTNKWEESQIFKFVFEYSCFLLPYRIFLLLNFRTISF